MPQPAHTTSAARRHRWWLEVVSGRRRGPLAATTRAGLTVLAGLYRVGLALTHIAKGRPRRAPVPVISVGNLTVGGTGKTPFVAAVATMVREMGRRPLIVSRGYKAPEGEPGDEARELARLCPDVPHVRGGDRLAAIEEFLAGGGEADVAILDDGFQHRRLARDLDIVLLDTTCPFGYDHVLPRGLLREPPSALARADLAVLTRAELVSGAKLADLKADVRLHFGWEKQMLVAEHRPKGLRGFGGTTADPASVEGTDVAAVCGIGNPEAFRRTLESLGARVAMWRPMPDHHDYTAEEIDALLADAEAAGVNTLVTTAKDGVKWRPLLEGRETRASVVPVVLDVELQITEGTEVLAHRIDQVLAGP